MSLDNPTTLKEAAEAILAGRITSVEMTTAALARAKSSHERLNAFIEIEEGPVLEAARAADVALAAGRTVGPLHGVPLAHKDMYDRAGFVTGCGSKIRKGHVATSTSTVMQRLQAAGALSIGRLNMSEFAMGPTGHNFHHGRAMNPIEAARITGGSSSGSGSAVGGGVVLAALGSDTGGSIRLPAACCGTVGIKPTQGRVSRHGAMPLSFSQDCVGPLARSVTDAYLLLQLIAGPDGHDTTCMDADKPGALLSDLSSLRIGIAGGPFADGLESNVAGGMETAIRALSPDVASITAAPLPDLSAIAELANAVAMAEAGTVHFDWMRECPEDYGPQIRMRLSQSLAIPAPIYLRALQMRSVSVSRDNLCRDRCPHSPDDAVHSAAVQRGRRRDEPDDERCRQRDDRVHETVQLSRPARGHRAGCGIRWRATRCAADRRASMARGSGRQRRPEARTRSWPDGLHQPIACAAGRLSKTCNPPERADLP